MDEDNSSSLPAVLNEPELLRLKAKVVYQILRDVYGPQALKPRDPLRQLINTILSQRTRDEETGAAAKSLWERWPSPEALAAADVAEIEGVIAGVTYPEVKAPRIKRLLGDIFAERGNYDLRFLGDVPTEQALSWLSRLEGVGPKTATLVMLFVFGHPVLPVDTHVHRVSLRLGLLPPRTSAARAHRLLLDLLPADASVLYTIHRDMIEHGKRICTFQAPRCPRCPLLPVCDEGSARVGRGKKDE